MAVLSEALSSQVRALAPEMVYYDQFLPNDNHVAMIGFGKMGMMHSIILNMLDRGSVRSIVDSSRFIASSIPRFVKKVNFYRRPEDMLRIENPNVVYVTTSTSSHYPTLCTLLDYNVQNIFVEKPPTVNLDEFRQLMSRVKHGVTIMVGFQKRFALTFRHAKMLLSKGVIGDVIEAKGYLKSSDIMTQTRRFDHLGRGVLLDLGIHLIDLLVWIFETSEVQVDVARYARIHTGVDDYFSTTLGVKECVKVDLEISWCSAEHRLPETYIELKGSNGMIRVTEDYLKVDCSESHTLLDNQKRLVMFKPHYYQGIPPVNLAEPEYTIENIHFLNSLTSSVQPMTSLGNTAKTMEIVEEMYTKSERLQNGSGTVAWR